MSLCINRFLSVMRSVSVIGIVVALMLCSTDLRAQSKKVTIVSSSATVGQVLKDIESQTGYLFVYNTSDIDVSGNVSLNLKDVAVSQVLEKILANQDVKWHLEGRYIKIMKHSSEAPKAAGEGSTAVGSILVKGKVTGVDGEPLIGASVIIKGTTNGVITGVDGSFSIEIPSKGAVIVASYLGFLDKEVETSGKLIC